MIMKDKHSEMKWQGEIFSSFVISWLSHTSDIPNLAVTDLG